MEERSDFGVQTALAKVADAYYAAEDSDELDLIVGGIVVDEESPEEAMAKLSLEEIYARRRTLQGIVRAAKAIMERVDDHMAARLGPTGFVRFGEDFLSVTTKARLRCVDPEGLREYLGDKWVECFDVNYPRKTQLKNVAKDKGDSEQTVTELFYVEEVSGPPRLSVAPVNRLKWTEKLPHGELGGGAQGF